VNPPGPCETAQCDQNEWGEFGKYVMNLQEVPSEAWRASMRPGVGVKGCPDLSKIGRVLAMNPSGFCEIA